VLVNHINLDLDIRKSQVCLKLDERHSVGC